MPTLKDAILKRKQRESLAEGSLQAIVVDIVANKMQEIFDSARPDLIEEMKPLVEETVLKNADEFKVKGDPGEPGDDADEAAIIEELSTRLPAPDEDKIVERLSERLPTIAEKKIMKALLARIVKKMPRHDEIVADVLERIGENSEEKKETEEIDYKKMADEVVARIKDNGFEMKDIKGLEKMLHGWHSKLVGAQKKIKIGGGGDVVTAGANVTITRTADGKRSIAAAGATGIVYSEVLTDSGDHQNFTAAHTITTVFSLMDGSGKGVPLKDASGNTNYTFSGTTVTLISADASLAALKLCIIYS